MPYQFVGDSVVAENGFSFNLKRTFQMVLRSNISNISHCKNYKFIIPTPEFMLNTFTANMNVFYPGQYKVSPEDKKLFVQFISDKIPDWADEILSE